MKTEIKIIIAIVVIVILNAFLSIVLWRSGRQRDFNEFHRGLMFGVNYHNKYGEYPSYHIWTKVAENPNINIDSLLRKDIFYLKPIVLIKDTIYIESIGKPEPNIITQPLIIKTKPTKKRHSFLHCKNCDTIRVNSPLYIDCTTVKGKRILKLAK